MRTSFVGLLRKSVSQSKAASRLQLSLCWCTSEACKYKKRNHSGGHGDFLLNCNIDCKKHIADEISHLKYRDFHQRFCRNALRVSGGFHPNQKFGTLIKTKFLNCQFSESRLFICRPKSEHNCSEKNARKIHVL